MLGIYESAQGRYQLTEHDQIGSSGRTKTNQGSEWIWSAWWSTDPSTNGKNMKLSGVKIHNLQQILPAGVDPWAHYWVSTLRNSVKILNTTLSHIFENFSDEKSDFFWLVYVIYSRLNNQDMQMVLLRNKELNHAVSLFLNKVGIPAAGRFVIELNLDFHVVVVVVQLYFCRSIAIATSISNLAKFKFW